MSTPSDQHRHQLKNATKMLSAQLSISESGDRYLSNTFYRPKNVVQLNQLSNFFFSATNCAAKANVIVKSRVSAKKTNAFNSWKTLIVKVKFQLGLKLVSNDHVKASIGSHPSGLV